jgi:hypothetical protein
MRQTTTTQVKSKRLFISAILAGGLSLVFIAGFGWANEIRNERVQFAIGTTGTTIADRIQGGEIVDYALGARAGQRMTVNLETDNPSNYFNVLAPGESEMAVFIGSNEGNHFEDDLPENGDYTIRVYLMRSAARRNESANYRLDMTITTEQEQTNASPSDTAASAAATRAGTGDFDATGQLPCSQYAGQPMTQCDFGVSREGGGTATVVITKPDGVTRAIFFIDGQANSADTSQADGYGEFSAEREKDLNLIRVGEERYEVSDAVIFGG